jgi:nucleoside-diphosphate-sugar epimerase
VIEKRVGLIGAASFVGERLVPLLKQDGYQVTTFSRQGDNGTVALRKASAEVVGIIEDWVCLSPVWTVSEHFELFTKYGVKRLVALSSTSRFSKISSAASKDRELASCLIKGEEQVLEWAAACNCTVVIFQPTLIYGLGKDKNVTEIARFIQRFGFFPLFGLGMGLRQPVHVDDVAAACLAGLKVPAGKKQTYILSGQEILTYRAMVERIFVALGRQPRFVRCPYLIFSLAVRLANLMLPFKGLTTEMAVRMNKNQNFDNTEVQVDLGFKPRPFHLQSSDLKMS